MKPPPLLLGATLVFWGWQSDLLLVGVLMGLVAECARFVRARWELSDEDFSRVWTFCSLLFLAAAVYAFNENNGPTAFGNWFQEPNFRTQGRAGISSARTAAAVFRWMPMIFFPFLAAQLFSTREAIPLTMISLILRRRWKKAKQAGKPLPDPRNVNIGYAYFAGTLLAASIHAANDDTFFGGLAVLLAWALWAQRSRRFSPVMWAGALVAAVLLGYFGQHGLWQLQRYLANLSPTWFMPFLRRNVDPTQSRTALGRMGEIKTSGRIVIRLQPKEGPPPQYLREATYRTYHGVSWSAGSSAQDFSGVQEEFPNSGSWNLLPAKTNRATANIACYLEGVRNASSLGLLPLPAGSWRLEKLPAYILQTNSAGSVLAEGPGLVIFDAHFGPGATIDSPPGEGVATNESLAALQSDGVQLRGGRYGLGVFTNAPARSAEHTNRNEALTENETPPPRLTAQAQRDRAQTLTNPLPRTVENPNQDLRVPDREEPALEQIMAELQLDGLPHEEVLRKVRAFFAENFTYRTWQPIERFVRGESHVSRFLLKTRAGHCEYFATATALLLRQAGIPTRYAVGYAVHETSGRGFVVRLRDAHAWCLVWNPDRQLWEDFDTTPASWIAAERQHASAWQWLADAWTRLKFEIAKIRWGQSNLRNYLLILIVPGLAVLLYQILFRRGRRRKKRGDGEQSEIFNWPGLDSEFYQLEKQLAERGVPRGASEPLNEWLERVTETPGLADLHEPLREILRLHYRYRFDPLGLSEEDREALRAQTRACLKELTRPDQSTVPAGK